MMEKVCNKCRISFKSKQYRDTLECPDCYNARKRAERKRRWENQKMLLVEELGGECNMCGCKAHKENLVIFDFHHIDPSEKEENISNLMVKKNFKEVREEALKCILLCSNCHRIHHYNEDR